MKSKRGQYTIGMSFGTIFSIILIIFILVIGFIAIRYFLDLKKCTQVSMFIDDLQNEIDRAWNSGKGEFEFSADLPSKLEVVCFANLSGDLKGDSEIIEDILFYSYGQESNMFLYPANEACELSNQNIKHLDLEEIVGSDNLNCFSIDNGNFKIQIVKERGVPLVRLS